MLKTGRLTGLFLFLSAPPRDFLDDLSVLEICLFLSGEKILNRLGRSECVEVAGEKIVGLPKVLRASRTFQLESVVPSNSYEVLHVHDTSLARRYPGR